METTYSQYHRKSHFKNRDNNLQRMKSYYLKNREKILEKRRLNYIEKKNKSNTIDDGGDSS